MRGHRPATHGGAPPPNSTVVAVSSNNHTESRSIFRDRRRHAGRPFATHLKYNKDYVHR